MHLFIDFGNTRFKWCLIKLDVVIGRGSITSIQIDSKLRTFDWVSISSIAICSVADSKMTQNIFFSCKNLSRPDCEVREVHLEHLPLWFSLGSTPKTEVGQDRVMAMLGAYQDSSSYSVIDAGTACTIDYVVDGEHKGGYIIPGLNTARIGLDKHAARIALEEDYAYSKNLEPARSTQLCVEHGIRLSLIAAVQRAIHASPWPLDRVTVTGGDGEWLCGHLLGPVKLSHDLVFQGMRRFFYGL